MMRGYMWVAAAAAPAMLSAAVLSGCGAQAESAAPAAAAAETQYTRAVNVEVLTLEPEPFTDLVRVVGVIQANRDVTVSAEEGGVVRAVHVEKGSRVAAGQPILKIDDALLQAQLAQAEADARLARERYERQRRLWEEEQVGSELTYLQARYAAEAAEANVRALRTRLERTTVRAPIAGILDARYVEVGTTVAPGTPLVRVVDVGTVKVQAGVPERYADEIGTGVDAFIQVDALRGREYAGRLQYVGTVVDDGSRTFPVEVTVPNPTGQLKPGLVANVGIARRSFETAVVVPRDAVLRSEDGFIAYVAVRRGDGWVAEMRPVVMGSSRGGRVVIESGLEPGDRLIVVGQQSVAAGDILRIVGSEQP